MGKKLAAFLGMCVISVTAAAGSAPADELVLVNGERLLGSFKHMQEGTVSFESETLGALTIPANKIRRLAVDTPRQAQIANGVSITVSAYETDTDTVKLTRPDVSAPVLVKRGDIISIDPPPQPTIAFSGDISSGIVDTHGSSSSTNANMDANLTIRTARQRLILDARWFYGREKEKRRGAPGGSRYVETDRNYNAGARYDYFLTKKLYSYLGTRYKRDTINDLRYRLVNSAGLGYQWVETSALKFSTDTGLALYKEKYVSRVKNPLYIPGGTQPKTLKETRRLDDLAWQAGTALEWRINTRFALIGQALYTQSIEGGQDYFLSTESELRLFLTKAFYCNLKTIFEYDNSPGADSDSTETKHIFGLGWSF